MKYKLLTLICLCCLLNLFAYEPVKIRQTSYLDFSTVRLKLSDSSILMFYNETSSGSSDILVQKVDLSGNSVWDAPRHVANSASEERIGDAVLTTDGNIVFMFFKTIPYFGSSCWVQKINPDGHRLWPHDGIYAGEDEIEKQGQLHPNSYGGVIICNLSWVSTNGISGISYDAMGNSMWEDDILLLDDSIVSWGFHSLSDGEGGIVVQVLDPEALDHGAYKIYHFDSQGHQQGDGPLISVPKPENMELRIMHDGEGIILYFFSMYGLVKLQKIDLQGNLLLPDYVEYNIGEPFLPYTKLYPKPKSAGGLVIAGSGTFLERELGFAIRLLNLDGNLQPLWPEMVSVSCQNKAIIQDINISDSIELLWIEGRQIYYSRIAQDSSLPFPVMELIDHQKRKRKPVFQPVSSGTMIVWHDFSEDVNSIRSQILDENGNRLLPYNGSILHSILNGDGTLQQSLVLGNNVIHMFSDGRGDIQQIYYQITSPDGQPILEQNGRALNPHSSCKEQYLDGQTLPSGNIAFIYSDIEDGVSKLWLQQIDQRGNKIWPHKGLQVAHDPENGYDFETSNIGIMGDGIYVVWCNDHQANNLYAQLYIEGSPMWQVGGKLIMNCGPRQIVMAETQENYVLCHVSYTLYSALVIHKLDDEGNNCPGWPQSLPFTLLIPNHSGISNGNLVLFYNHWENSNNVLRVQMLSRSGEHLWGAYGISLHVDQKFYDIADAIYGEDIYCLSYCYNEGVYMVHQINQAGELVWNSFGQNYSLPGYNFGSGLLLRTDQNKSIAFLEYYNDEHRGLYRGVISDTGDLIGDESGFFYANTFGIQGLHKAIVASHPGTLSWNRCHVYCETNGKVEWAGNEIWVASLDMMFTDNQEHVYPVVNKATTYPNPFRESTTIRFENKQTNTVSLDIFNLKGQLVRRLNHDSRDPGTCEITWDGRDMAGNRVGNGIYYYRLKSGITQHCGKMILIK